MGIAVQIRFRNRISQPPKRTKQDGPGFLNGVDLHYADGV
jgi:hypothetical protein